MKRLAFVLLLFLLTFFLSCKKDPVMADVYPLTYYKFDIKPAGPLRLFTSKGEVTNPSALYWFYFYKTDDTALYNISASYVAESYFMGTVKFTDAQNAILLNQFLQDDSCMANLQTSELILTSRDTSEIYSDQDLFIPGINQYIGKVKPDIFSQELISSVGGQYLFEYSFHQKYVFKKTGTKLSAPIIQFVIYNKFANSAAYVNNTLDKDFYKNLSADDTISLREYNMLYEKQ